MHEAPPDPRPAPTASARRSGGGSCLAALAAGVIGGLIGAVVTAAVLAVVWQPFSDTDADTPAGTATQTPQPGVTIDVPDADLSYAEAVAVKAMPSVVSVAIEQSVYDPFTGGTTTQVVGNGSGVIIRADGYIVTNDHVVASADAISVTIGVDTLPATVVGRDPSSDLAVLKVDRAGLPAIEVGSSADLRVGQPVVAIGSPFGLDQSLTTGVVSALGRTSYMESAEAQLTAYTSLIQTDAAINPGNSGGALTDAEGRLIGINTLIQTGSEYVAQSAGVGFAIPVDYAISVADDLIETGRAEHPYLGVSSMTISEQIAAWYQLPVDAGVLVDSVAPDSPAESAGLQAGDIIVGIGDDRVASMEDMFLAIRSHQIGDDVSVDVVRGEETLTLDVTLGSDGAR
jgi:putative serine protease PepD